MDWRKVIYPDIALLEWLARHPIKTSPWDGNTDPIVGLVTELDYEDSIKKHVPPRNKEEIIAILKLKNPARMFSLRRNYKWVQRQMKKMGLNPEDARWIL